MLFPLSITPELQIVESGSDSDGEEAYFPFCEASGYPGASGLEIICIKAVLNFTPAGKAGALQEHDMPSPMIHFISFVTLLVSGNPGACPVGGAD